MIAPRPRVDATDSGGILWLGDAQRPDFAPLIAFLHRYVPVLCRDRADVRFLPFARNQFRLVIIATSGDTSPDAADFDAIRDRYPAATIVQLRSAWHERSGRTPTHEYVHQVPWHALCGWWSLHAAHGILAESTCDTVTHAGSCPREPAALQLAVIAAHRQIAEIHESMLQAHGIQTDWVPALPHGTRLDRYDAFLWDESAYGRARVASLDTWRDAVGGRLMIALRSPANIVAPVEGNVFSMGQPYRVDEIVALLQFQMRQVSASSPLARSA